MFSRLANFAGTSDKATIDAKHAGRSGLADYVRELFDASLNWDDLRWLVNLTTLPVGRDHDGVVYLRLVNTHRCWSKASCVAMTREWRSNMGPLV